MAVKKKFNTWEKEFNCIVVDATDKQLDSKITEEEFRDIAYPAPGQFAQAIFWADRIKFLEDNGYDVTRQNISDANLSVRQPEEK